MRRAIRGLVLVATSVSAVLSLAVGLGSAGGSERIGDLGFASRTAVLPELGRAMASDWPSGDISSSGELALYVWQPSENMWWVISVASTVTGEVYEGSLLPGDVFGNPDVPALSPDGTRVSFCTAIGTENTEVGKDAAPWVVNLDGSGLAQLREDGYDYSNSAWRPDGKIIAFCRTHAGDIATAEVIMLDPDTGEIMRSMQRHLTSFRFSPDGRWLVGMSEALLVALDLTTGEERVLWDPKQQPNLGGHARAFAIGPPACVPYGGRVLFNVGHRDFSLPDGPVSWEIWEAGLLESWASRKVAEGAVLAASPDGRRLLVDSRVASTIYARRSAGQAELQAGDLRLLTGTGLLPSAD